jgi:hypothetical protein
VETILLTVLSTKAGRTRFVGRKSSLAALKEALDEAVAGRVSMETHAAGGARPLDGLPHRLRGVV